MVVDTDVLIDYSKGFGEGLGKILERRDRGEVGVAICGVSLAEFLTDKQLKEKSNLKRAMEFLNQFRCLAPTKKICELAGELGREGKVFSLPDAMIAATCMVNRCQLATRNVKHFKKVGGLSFINKHGLDRHYPTG